MDLAGDGLCDSWARVDLFFPRLDPWKAKLKFVLERAGTPRVDKSASTGVRPESCPSWASLMSLTHHGGAQRWLPWKSGVVDNCPGDLYLLFCAECVNTNNGNGLEGGRGALSLEMSQRKLEVI